MLDLLMPEMDGYEVLAQMQRLGLINRIPVIVLTAEKLAEVKSLKLGAADFISKPYDMPEVILARVHRSIELAESYMVLNKTENDSLRVCITASSLCSTATAVTALTLISIWTRSLSISISSE